MLKLLEIGPGDGPAREGKWDTLAADKSKPATYHARWGYNSTLPIESNTYDLVYASHVIEHIPWYLTRNALGEVRRILKPGGRIELWTVDFDKVVRAYLDKKIPDHWRRHNPSGDLMTWVNGRIFAYAKYDDRGDDLNLHRSCFTFESLVDQLTAVGFSNCTSLDSPRGEDHGVINLGVGATK